MKCNVRECQGERATGDVLCAEHVAMRDAWSDAARRLVEGAEARRTEDGRDVRLRSIALEAEDAMNYSSNIPHAQREKVLVDGLLAVWRLADGTGADRPPARPKRWAASVMGSRIAVARPAGDVARIAMAVGALPQPVSFQSSHEVLTLTGPTKEESERVATAYAWKKWPEHEGWKVQVAVVEVPR